MSFYNPKTNPEFGQPPKYTPESRLGRFSGGDRMLRTAQVATVDITLADGESYNLGGFAPGVYRVMWTEDASSGGVAQFYAEFQAYIATDGSYSTKIMDTEGGTADRHSNSELLSVSSTPANDTIHFFVNADDELVLTNGTATSGTDRVLEIHRLR